jgi:uncharacterized membrane protein YdcZ (DUF606 family)
LIGLYVVQVMSEPGGGWIAAVMREVLASSTVILALWGALGGATSALTTRMRLRDALRHIVIGAFIAAGMGSLSMVVIAAWLRLPEAAIPAGGAAGSAAYLVGVFGAAFVEMVHARLRAAQRDVSDQEDK